MASNGGHMTRPEFIYVFDANNRVYAKPEPGKYTGAPIWIKHWTQCRVVGETARSWLIEYGMKIPKKPNRYHEESPCYSFREVQQRDWAQKNRRALVEAIQSRGMGCLSPEQVSSVAIALGMPGMPEFEGEYDG